MQALCFAKMGKFCDHYLLFRFTSSTGIRYLRIYRTTLLLVLSISFFTLQETQECHNLSSVLALSAIFVHPFLCTPLNGKQCNKCPWNEILEVACSLNTYTKPAPKVCLAIKVKDFILLQPIKSIRIFTRNVSF